MDLGLNPLFSRYRTRIFGPTSADISFATHASGTAPTSQSSFTDRLVIRGDSGFVGIGTGTPSHPFEITAPAVINNGSREVLAVYDTTSFGAGVGGGITFGGKFNSAGTIAAQFVSIEGIKENGTDGDFASAFRINTRINGGQPTERFRVTSFGNIGIGTANPAVQFHLLGTSTIQGRIETTGNAAAALDFKNPSRRWVIGTGLTTGGGDFSLYDINAGLTRMYFDTAGNVSIGTNPPNTNYRLDVQGGSLNASGGLCIAGDCKTLWSQVGGSSQWTTSGTTINYTTGNVGIGATNPGYRLDVNDLAAFGSHATNRAIIGATTSSGGVAYAGSSASGWAFGLTTNNASSYDLYLPGSGNVGINETSPGSRLAVKGGLSLGSTTTFSQAAAPSGGAIIEGRLGIGITNPTEALHVAGNGKVTGNLTVDGNIAAKYQDMAEWVPSAHALPAGTVTVLDPTQSNRVMASAKAYDTRVAGVISEQPGIALGEAGANKVLVATTGRVRVKVDATRGPINIGDLLVTSDIEGVAMKSQPLDLGGVAIHRPGTLIGKALEPLAKGRGEILVLLSLQ